MIPTAKASVPLSFGYSGFTVDTPIELANYESFARCAPRSEVAVSLSAVSAEEKL